MRHIFFFGILFISSNFTLSQQINIDSTRIENYIKTGDSLFNIQEYYESTGYYLMARKSTNFIVLASDTTSSKYKYYFETRKLLDQKIFRADSLFSIQDKNEYFIKTYKKNALKFNDEGDINSAIEEYKNDVVLNPEDSLSKAYILDKLQDKKDTIYLGIDSKIPSLMDSSYNSLNYFTDYNSPLYWTIDTTPFKGVIIVQEIDVSTFKLNKTIIKYKNGMSVSIDNYLSKNLVDAKSLILLSSSNNVNIESDTFDLIFHTYFIRSPNKIIERTKYNDSLFYNELIYHLDEKVGVKSSELVTINQDNDTIFYSYTSNEKQINIFYQNGKMSQKIIMLSVFDSQNNMISQENIIIDSHFDTIFYELNSLKKHIINIYEEGQYLGKEVSIRSDNSVTITQFDFKNRIVLVYVDSYLRTDTLHQYFYEENITFKITSTSINLKSIQFLNNDCYYLDKRKFLPKNEFSFNINYYDLDYFVFIYPYDLEKGIFIPIVVSSRVLFDLSNPEDEAKFRKKLTKQMK